MLKKELIRITAIDLFAAKGYYNTSTPMIAEAAQISIGTIYNYFKNKDEILDYIFQVEYKLREDYLLSLEKLDIPITEKVTRFIDIFFDVIKENPQSAKLIIHSIMNPKIQKLESVHKFRQDLSRIFTSLLITAHKKGEITNINPELVGPAIYLAIRCVSYTVQISTGNDDFDMAKMELKSYINYALQGTST